MRWLMQEHCCVTENRFTREPVKKESGGRGCGAVEKDGKERKIDLEKIC